MSMNYRYPNAVAYLAFFPHGKGRDGKMQIPEENLQRLSENPSPREVGEFLGAKPGDMWEIVRVSEFGHSNQYRMFSDTETIKERAAGSVVQDPEYGWIWPQHFRKWIEEEST